MGSASLDSIPREDSDNEKSHDATFARPLAGAPYILRGQPAGRFARPHQDRHRARHRRHRSEDLRQLHRAPRPLHRRRHLRREVAALRCERLPQGRARGRQEAERHAAALAGRQLLLELPLEGRHRPARPASAAPRDGLGHGREQSLRHARVPRSTPRCSAPSPTSAPTSAPAPGPRRSSGWSTCNSVARTPR